MTRLLNRLLPMLLLGLVLTPMCSISYSNSFLVSAEDPVEDEEEEDDDMTVEDEVDDEDRTVHMAPDSDETPYGDVDDVESTEEEEEEEEELIGPSPDAETIIMFKGDHDEDKSPEFYAGSKVHSLVGFTNTGEQPFVITGIEASFRYPQDFSYYIQNFSMVYFETYVPPSTQATFDYIFKPSETLYARPFGLVVNIYYKDEEGNEFRHAAFNNTVNIVEVQEGFDAETFFIYLFMVSGLCLLMFIIHYVWTTVKRGGGRPLKKAPPVEMGTGNKRNKVDYSWLPEGTIPKKSPRQQSSPRSRQKAKNKQEPLKVPDVD